MHRVYNEFIWHASEGVEDDVAEEAALDVPVVEVVEEDFHHVVEEVPRLGAVDAEHELRVGTVEPHDEADPEDQVEIVPAHHGVERWTNHSF